MDFFFELYKDLPKQGPGSDPITKKALSYIPNINQLKLIVDAGCGTGRQTLVLANNTSANIIAIDVLEQQLAVLKTNVSRHKLEARVAIHNKSMDDLSFIMKPVDLIWAEGAIYNVGFEKGLLHFHDHLKPGGYVAVTEVSWFTSNPTKEIKSFWQEQYPNIKTVDENIEIIKSCNFDLINNFHVPSIAWWNDYYDILNERVEQYKLNRDLNEEAKQVLTETEVEIKMFRKYSEQYGYEFYIMAK